MKHHRPFGIETIDRTDGGITRTALLTFLVVHAGCRRPGPGAADRRVVCPESTDGQALTNLRRELHHLRQVLAEEPSFVVTSMVIAMRVPSRAVNILR